MKTKQIQALESYFKTENEHWNSFTFRMLCEVLKQGEFENPEMPLQLFSNATDMFVEKHEIPLQAVQQFADELEKYNLTVTQKIFVYNWVCKYLNDTEYENLDLMPIKTLLDAQIEKLQEENESQKPQVKNIRELIKETMQKEFEQLDNTMKELTPAQRLNILSKLVPYVLPKVEAINSEDDNPTHFNVSFR